MQGLTEAEVLRLRAQGKGNNVGFKTSRSYLEIIRSNVFTFINMLLFGVGFVLLLLGLPGDALATAGLVMLNVIVGMAQEIRAKQKLDQIALLTRPKITAIREGQEKVIDPGEIVVGDLLIINPGDQIVVDGTLQGDGRVEIDESLLTGESDRIVKSEGDLVYSGSFCVTGKALYQATRVGADSFANKMTAQARDFRLTLTPLQRDLNFILRLLALISFIIGILVYIGSVRNDVPLEQRVQALAVIIGLIPQGLIFLTTLSYALGAVRMARRGALVQNSAAVESMSNIDVLCLDKTGTLTTNRIQFSELCPLGDTKEDDLKRLLGIVAASASAGNRTSEAINEALKGTAQKMQAEVPFSSERKWSGAAFDLPDMPGLYILGAPEILQPNLKTGADIGQTQADQWRDQGLRVVLFCSCEGNTFPTNDKQEPSLPKDLLSLGLIAMSDEIRPEAQATLAGFAEAGIQIKIISGDNPQTVAALAQQAKIPGVEGWQLATGPDLAKLDDTAFAAAAEKTTVFGRITPYQKEQLMRSLQAQGHYVAMIGDGVNDVLSLKQAEIGIAMQSGSSATRSVADIVLLGDNFGVLPDAFKEGQRIVNGMQDIVRILLSRTFYVVFLILGTAMLGVTFPLKPTYDTLVATLTVGITGPAIAAWARPGKPQRSTIKSMIQFVLPAAFTISILALVVYLVQLDRSGNDILVARTSLTATLVFCGLLLLPFVEPPTPGWVAGEDYSGDWRPTYMGVLMLALFLAILLIPTLRDAFDLVALPITDYIAIVIGVVIWTIVLRTIWLARVLERFLDIEL